MSDVPPDGSTPYGHRVVQVTTPPPIDKVSIMGLAVTVAMVFPPVALALGIAGLVRTRKGIRTGRWAAVVATIGGAVTSVAVAVLIAALIWIDTSGVSVDEAGRGTCVDLDEEIDGIQMHERDCREPHDAEVVYQGQFTSNLLADYGRLSTTRFCLRAIRDLPLPDIDGPNYTLSAIVDSVSVSRPDIGDAFVCVLERADREPLTDPLDYLGEA